MPIAEVGTPRVEPGFLSDALVVATPDGLWRLTLLREPGRRPEAVAARLAALAARTRSGRAETPARTGTGS